MTLFFSNHQIQIYRSHPKGNNKYTYSATFTAYSADIQPMGPERAELYGGRFGKTWDAYTDVTVDVKEGDIIVSNGIRYGVKAVSTWRGAGLLDHRQLVLESKDNA